MKKLIDHYKEWDKKGELPKNDLNELASLGMSCGYWGSGLNMFDSTKEKALTPLRETIILLICAMHDEI